MAAPPEAVPIREASVDTHPVMRVQFFLHGPFDPMESLSVTFLDAEWNVVESVVLGGSHAQYELWQRVADIAADFLSQFGMAEQLPLNNDEAPPPVEAGLGRTDG